MGSSTDKIPGWYKPGDDIYLSLGSLGEKAEPPVDAEAFRFTLQVGQYTEGADFHTASFEGVEYRLTDQNDNLYEPSSISAGSITYSNLSVDNTYTFTASKEGWAVVTQGEWDVEAHAYIYTFTGEDTIVQTITKDDDGKNITEYTNPGMVFRKKPREENVVDLALASVPEGLNYDIFTEDTANALRNAIEAADPEAADENELNAMAEAITNALQGLIPKDGRYEIDLTKYNGTPYYLFEGLGDSDRDNGKVILVVENGVMTAEIVLKNQSYGQVCLGTKDEVIEAATAAGTVPEGTIDLEMPTDKITVNGKEYAYTTGVIPVPALQKKINYAYHSSNTGRYTYNTGWYDHGVMFLAASIKEEQTNPEEVITELAITNNTGMFKAVTAYLSEKDGSTNLIMALSGTGYHELFKGTYEQASANGDNRDNWIHGYQNDAGLWEFAIPIEEGESYVPCVAISQSYLDKYYAGQNSLERAFYPRQFEVDKEAKTLVTGDYEFSKELAVTNNVGMFKVDAARIDTVGGPNSNNYAADLVLTMGSTSYGKAYVGTAGEAHKAAAPAVLGEDNTFRLSVKWVETFGQPETLKNLLDEPFVVSFYSTKKDAWYERKLTVSEAEGTIIFDSVPQADYKAVAAAIAKVPSDLSIYTDETAQAVEDALAGVVQFLGAEQQAEVDAMAEAIEAAVAALKEKPADYTAVDAALAKVPSDLTIYTEETAAAVTAAVGAVVRDLGITKQAEVDAMAQAIEEAVGALVKIEDANAAKAADELIQKAKEAYDTAAEKQKAVDDAQAAYNDLTDVQKALLPNAEADLQAAQEAATEMMNTEKAANDAAEAAKTLIDAVKTAAEDENTTAAEVAQAIEAAKEALKTAQEAYGKLNDKQKAQEGQINVDDIASEAEGVFTEAEAAVTAKQTTEAVEAVKKAAETAKDPKANSKDVNDAIKAAEDALNVLTDEQKQQVEEQIKEELGKSVDQIISDAKAAAAAKEEAEKKAEDANKNTGGSQQNPTPSASSQQGTTAPAVSIGMTFTVNKLTYQVTEANTVSLLKNTNKKAKSVTIPAAVSYQGQSFNVTSVADKAFAGNKKLTKVTLGKNVTSIGKQAFKGDKKLKKVIFKGILVKKIGKKAFSGIKKNATFKAPKKALKKYRKLIKKAGAPKTAKYKK